MRTFFLSTSTKPDKKYMVFDYEQPDKVIHFGQKGFSDFLHHKSPLRKKAYILRHRVREDWTDLSKPGTWSRYLLWGEPTLEDSIKAMEKRFNIQILT